VRHPASSFGGGERLGNEWLGALAPGRSDPPWADAKIVIPFHFVPTRTLSSSQNSQRIIAFNKVMAGSAPLQRTLLFLDFLPIRPPSKVRLLSCRLNRVSVSVRPLHVVWVVQNRGMSGSFAPGRISDGASAFLDKGE
jgi:hypothetical protein